MYATAVSRGGRALPAGAVVRVATLTAAPSLDTERGATDADRLTHPVTGLGWRLNPTARFLWAQMQVPVPVGTLRDRAVEQFSSCPGDVAGDVDRFVRDLVEHGFVEVLHPDDRSTVLRRRYLRLLKDALVNLIYPEHELRLRLAEAADPDGDDRARQRALRDIRTAEPEAFEELIAAKQDGRNFRRAVTRDAHTMVGRRRLDNIEWCAVEVFDGGVDGDFLEAGVCQGGAAIFMRATQVAYGQEHRRMWVADSFQGLPAPEDTIDGDLDLTEGRLPWLAASLETVRHHFRTYELLTEQVQFLPGWFRDTLTPSPVQKLALLRIDADLHSSTRDVLTALYDRVEPGGFVIVDDYGAFAPCRDAVDGFRAERAIADPLRRVDWTAVYWQKQA